MHRGADDEMSIRHSFSQGDLASVILAYDDTQNTAHSITQSPEICIDDVPLRKGKSRKTWNTRRLKHFSEQLLKPFATISIKTKSKRPSLSNLANSYFSMMRNLPPPPPDEGVVPEDDYSTFDAWEGDFDDDPEPEEVSPRSGGKMNFGAKGAVPLPPKTGPSRSVPLPPRNDDDVPPPIIPRGAGLPVNRQTTAPFNPQTAMPPARYRSPSPDDSSEDYLAPSRNSFPEEDEEYLAPQMQEEQEYAAAEEEETYEDADEMSSPPARNPMSFRALPPQPGKVPPPPPRELPHPPKGAPQPSYEDEYEAAPEEENYEDADEIQSRTTKPQGFRALPPQPGRPPMQPPVSSYQEEEYEEPPQDQTYEDTGDMQSSKPRGFRALPPHPRSALPQPGEGECDYHEDDNQTYEDADDMRSQPSRMLSQKLPPRIEDDDFDDDDDEVAYDAPEDLVQNKGPQSRAIPPVPGSQQSRPAGPIPQSQRDWQENVSETSNIPGFNKKFQQAGPGQMKLCGTDTLRQKLGGLRKVIPTFDKNMNISDDNRGEVDDDDDDEEDASGQGGIKNILNKLAKKSSMFERGQKPNAVEPKTKTLPAAGRSLPQPPQPSRPLPDPSSYQPSRSLASSNNSSENRTFMPRRGSADVPTQAQSQRLLPPVQKQRDIPVEEEIWFFDIERNEVEEKLDQVDGMYLVRRSKFGGPRSPYTLCVFNSTRVYNLNIRYRDDGVYALGTPHANEKTFKTVRELIDYHQQHPITLADKDRSTVLLNQIPPHDEIYDQTA